jgi:iron complex transport system permease protein
VTRPVALLLAALALAVPLSLLAGQVWLDPFAPGASNAVIILGELRAPRAALALIIGAGLGASGAAMQGYLRNPLADPGLFGVAPTAAFGAVLALALGLGALLPLAALAGAAAAMAALGLIAGGGTSGSGGQNSTTLFALAGLMLASLSGALTSLIISLAPNPFALSEIVTWLMGSLESRSWHDVALAAPPTVLGLALLLRAGPALDALTLGEETARSLGVDPARLLRLMVLATGLVVGAGVAAAGNIGFVGLVVPHLLRPFTDQRPSSLIVPSALGGALLLLLADCLCRLLPLAGGELRIGIALSLLGAPFFLRLLLKLRSDLA